MKRSWVALLLLLVFVLVEALATGHRLFYNLTYLLAAIVSVSYFWSWSNIHHLHLVRQTRSQRSQVCGWKCAITLIYLNTTPVG